jgi:hypothetical protein
LSADEDGLEFVEKVLTVVLALPAVRSKVIADMWRPAACGGDPR